METNTNNEPNRLWFEFYTKELDSGNPTDSVEFDEYFLCPCCHLPTLTSRGGFEVCSICNWEDDGQDNHNADKILGGPNSNYSLTEARENFKKYLTSYRPSDTHNFSRTTVKKTFDGKVIRDLTKIKDEAIREYTLAMFASNSTDRKRHLKNAIDFEKKLS